MNAEIRLRDSGFVFTAPEVGAEGDGIVGQKCCGGLRIDFTACGVAPLSQKFGHAAAVQGLVRRSIGSARPASGKCRRWR
jgi:hypothetical protein